MALSVTRQRGRTGDPPTDDRRTGTTGSTRSGRSGRSDPTGLNGRDFRLLMIATLGTFANYAALLAVVPLWSAEGGAKYGGVGAATGVTMAATVAVQFCMGSLLRRLSLRQILAVGALLLGLPTFAYPFSSGLGFVLAVCAVRGVGFGMVAVAGSALTADLVPEHQRGRAVGRYGFAVGLPQVVLLPLGVWTATAFGFTAVFLVTGALCVLTVPLVLAMSGRRAPRLAEEVRDDGRVDGQADGQGGEADAREGSASAGVHEPGTGGPGGTAGTDRTAGTDAQPRGFARYRELATPFALLLASAGALGGLTSFLPLSLDAPGTAPVTLTVLFTAGMVGRWAAGVRSDRVGVGGLLPASVAACALGMAGFAATDALGGAGSVAEGVAAVASAAVFGLGFGALQNDTLVVMFRRAGPEGSGTASTVWNMAYDGGTGAGSLATGLLAQGLGFAGGFVTAALVIAGTAPWSRPSKHRPAPHHAERHHAEPRSPEPHHPEPHPPEPHRPRVPRPEAHATQAHQNVTARPEDPHEPAG
ncbi:MFS transporter [Streptomyces sp. NPDC054796]